MLSQKQVIRVKDASIECAAIELRKQLDAIKMLNNAIDGFSDLARRQADKIKVYEECTRMHH